MDKCLIIYNKDNNSLEKPLLCAEFCVALGVQAHYASYGDLEPVIKSCKRNDYSIITYSLEDLGGINVYNSITLDHGISVYFVDSDSVTEVLL